MKFRTPQYRRHASGQAPVHIRGQDFYLGKYGAPESKEAYHRPTTTSSLDTRDNQAARELEEKFGL